MAKSKRSIEDVQLTPSYIPVESRTVPLGSGASLHIQSNCSAEDLQSLMRLAKRVLDNPKAMQQVSDRVYELMTEEWRYAQDHRSGYRSRF